MWRFSRIISVFSLLLACTFVGDKLWRCSTVEEEAGNKGLVSASVSHKWQPGVWTEITDLHTSPTKLPDREDCTNLLLFILNSTIACSSIQSRSEVMPDSAKRLNQSPQRQSKSMSSDQNRLEHIAKGVFRVASGQDAGRL